MGVVFSVWRPSNQSNFSCSDMFNWLNGVFSFWQFSNQLSFSCSDKLKSQRDDGSYIEDVTPQQAYVEPTGCADWQFDVRKEILITDLAFTNIRLDVQKAKMLELKQRHKDGKAWEQCEVDAINSTNAELLTKKKSLEAKINRLYPSYFLENNN